MTKILFAATFILVGLKLFDVIEWPWLAILSPIWLPIAAVASILLAVTMICFGCYYVDERKKKNDIWRQ